MKPLLILPEQVTSFMNVFKKNGFAIYVVGGAVRDLFLKRKTKNWDFTTNAKPEKIQELFSESFYNNDYGTVSIPVKWNQEKIIFEVTPFRKESDYIDFRHPKKVTWTDSITDDLKRRDFTINAIAYDGITIVDPFGGEADIKNKIIRAVGEPDKRLLEDALRLIRAVRIACELGFMIDNTTRASIQSNAQLITNISWERIRDELFKIIGSENPSDGILFLRNMGLLKYILPEVDDCFAIPQKSPLRHHMFDVGTHLAQALKLCPSNDVITRFATLLHDIGKAPTFKKDAKTNLITFYNHEIVGAEMVVKIADRLRLSKKEKDKLFILVRFHMFTVSEKQTDKAIKRFIRNVGKDYLFDILDLRVADRLGSGAKLTSWRTELFKKRLEEVQKEPFKITDLKINGNEVMKILNLKPGPQVGKILQDIFNVVAEGKLKNERSKLVDHLRRFSKISKSGVATKGDE